MPSISMAQEVTAVPSVDLSRYVGKWYEIARFPNSFQKACTGNVTAQYRSRADGKIDVINRCKKNDGSVDEAVGLARVSNDSGSATNSRLKVRFAPEWLSWLPLVWGDYWVLDLAPDYSYAVVGEPGRKYLWVLSRTPKLTDSTYRAALAKVAAQGFDVSKLVKTPQE
ncbi:lipocalin family protein [Glaciimonas immobilis]|uniref:Outer membrane lipoprotein Blc n=1 Tax=Glaciimonas immobilis TaxID=728004 RepID=A0A840RN79_9BURK|nr:lipocalin family protein [Glaciimonas immobilis]MBB5199787.1 apolipoprotein D and lipocalin family protein [Glaciimonas immobilis]